MSMPARKVETVAILIAASVLSNAAWAFNSGSTGADGAFNPTASTQLQLPPSGIFNFTTVNIPSGVTITFKRNAANTPVVILATGDVTIGGTINLNGSTSPNVGAAGNGNIADDGLPGRGGPGGYDGGHGALAGFDKQAGSGLGPGGGGGAKGAYISGAGWYPGGGGGGGFSAAGGNGGYAPSYQPGAGGPAYGASTLLPLVGGSGGGGGSGGSIFGGSGGGGGGGAILIASSGTVNVTGAIYASGNASGASSGAGCGGTGGGGGGGAVRIVATTIAGNGAINAVGAGVGGTNCGGTGGIGGSGRIRLEAENITRTASTNPGYAFAAPGTVFVPGLPTLKITDVAGAPVPASPTGNADVSLPADIANPVTVGLAATGIPLGTTITLTVKPSRGQVSTTNSTALAGAVESSTATASVTLPPGPSVLSATTSYTLTAAAGDALSMFAKGERVEKVELLAGINGTSTVTLVSVSGKRYTLPSPLVPSYIAG